MVILLINRPDNSKWFINPYRQARIQNWFWKENL